MDQVGKLARCQYPAPANLSQNEQIVIAGYQAIRAASHGQTDDVKIVGIAADLRDGRKAGQNFTVVPEETDDLIGCGLGQPDLPPQISMDLLQQLFVDQYLVAVEAEFEDDLTESVGGERRHADVGVEHHSHEIALKTSSSVR